MVIIIAVVIGLGYLAGILLMTAYMLERDPFDAGGEGDGEYVLCGFLWPLPLIVLLVGGFTNGILRAARWINRSRNKR